MTRQPRYSMSEFARRGTEIYEQRIRPLVEGEHDQRLVAIDIETGEFEIADTVLAASDQLTARVPDAQIWIVRVGSRAVHRIGAWKASNQT